MIRSVAHVTLPRLVQHIADSHGNFASVLCGSNAPTTTKATTKAAYTFSHSFIFS
jgi:hypothetical protein